MGSTHSDDTRSSRSSSSSCSTDATTYGPPDGHLFVEPGQVLGPFTIESRLGRGQFGIVYSVKEDEHKAVKVFRCVDDPDEQEHIENERRLLAGFPPDNDHVLRFFDCFEHGAEEDVPHTVFVMERMASDLFHVMESGGLDLPMGRRLARQLLRAVSFLGESGLIHYDLKPENVLVRGDGVNTVLKLCDFGTCRDPTQPVPDFGKTWEYRAPEVVLGYEAPSHAADVFSVGCILYELFVATYGDTVSNVLFDVRSVTFETLVETEDDEEDDESTIDHKHAYLFQEILGPVPRPYLLRCCNHVRFDARGKQQGLDFPHAVERCPLANYLACDGVPEEHIPDMAGLLSTLLVYVPEKRVPLLDLLDHPLVA